MNDVKLGCHVGMAGKRDVSCIGKKTIPPYKKEIEWLKK